MLEFIKKALSRYDEPSSKRLVMFLAFFVFVISLFLAQIFGLLIPSIYIETLKWIILGGAVTVASEGFNKEVK